MARRTPGQQLARRRVALQRDQVAVELVELVEVLAALDQELRDDLGVLVDGDPPLGGAVGGRDAST
jgi:hypothetical protein